MKKLTENLIQQRIRTCTTDLDKVLQINITGRELEDVSLLRKMTGVEILSLSVNRISSLVDFQNCKNLKELYLRHNNISDLNELYYLKNLPKLELLMLSENPCSNDPLYRQTTIKNLKNLIELDGIGISNEERKEASKLGKEIFICPNSNSTPFTFTGNISDGSHIQRTPTQSIKKMSHVNNAPNELIKGKSKCELGGENYDLGIRKMGDEVHGDMKPITNCEILGIRSPKHVSETKPVISNVDEDLPKMTCCKFCKGLGSEQNFSLKAPSNDQFLRIIPKSSNILSAVLNLVKELDYPSLQIVNAEVASRLNAYQIDLVLHSAP